MSQLEAKIAVLKSASTEEVSHSEGLQQQLSAAQQELASKQAHMQGLEKQLADVHARESEQAATLDQLNVQLGSAHEELTASQAQAQGLEEQVADAQARAKDMAAAKKDLEEQLSSLRTELAGSRGELCKAGEQLADAQAREAEKATAIEQMQREKVNTWVAQTCIQLNLATANPPQCCKSWRWLNQSSAVACFVQPRSIMSHGVCGPSSCASKIHHGSCVLMVWWVLSGAA